VKLAARGECEGLTQTPTEGAKGKEPRLLVAEEEKKEKLRPSTSEEGRAELSPIVAVEAREGHGPFADRKETLRSFAAVERRAGEGLSKEGREETVKELASAASERRRELELTATVEERAGGLVPPTAEE
jgi:hypothetical protein